VPPAYHSESLPSACLPIHREYGARLLRLSGHALPPPLPDVQCDKLERRPLALPPSSRPLCPDQLPLHLAAPLRRLVRGHNPPVLQQDGRAHRGRRIHPVLIRRAPIRAHGPDEQELRQTQVLRVRPRGRQQR